jgi:hypothetical protein
LSYPYFSAAKKRVVALGGRFTFMRRDFVYLRKTDVCRTTTAMMDSWSIVSNSRYKKIADKRMKKESRKEERGAQTCPYNMQVARTRRNALTVPRGAQDRYRVSGFEGQSQPARITEVAREVVAVPVVGSTHCRSPYEVQALGDRDVPRRAETNRNSHSIFCNCRSTARCLRCGTVVV